MTEIDAQLAASLATRFRLIRRLGAGGMGAVYLAEQIAVGNRPRVARRTSPRYATRLILARIQTAKALSSRVPPARPSTAWVAASSLAVRR